MIIKIDSSILNSVISLPNPQYLLLFLEKVAQTVVCGYHCVVSDRCTLEGLSSLDDASSFSRSIFRKLSNKISFVGGFLEQKFAIRFIYSDSLSATDFNEVFVVNLFDFKGDVTSVDRFLGRSSLIVEDVEDVLVYNLIIDSYKLLKGGNYSLDFVPVHGGGDRSHEVCSMLYAENFNIFAICDSDKKYPKSNCGATALKLINFFETESIKDRLHVLNCHEVENLIPLSVINNKANPTQRMPVDFILNSVSLSSDSYLYYDFKKGHKYKDVFQVENSFSEYWKVFYSEFNCPNYLNRLDDFKLNKLDCSAVLTGSTSSLLSLIKKDIKDGGLKVIDFSELNPSCLIELWKLVGEVFYIWFISTPQIRL